MADLTASRKAAGWGTGIAGAIALVLASISGAEGGFVDHPDDPGGATNFGVTEGVARQCGFKGRMRDMTQAEAQACLERLYILKPGFDYVIMRSVALGEEASDQSVNMGSSRPSRYLQTALNSLNRQGHDYPDIAVDGQVGPATLRSFDALARKRGNTKACEVLLKLMDAQQGAEYIRLTQRNPKLETFQFGWVDTRIGNVPIARCADGGAK